jgi:anti-anti-sigma factor
MAPSESPSPIPQRGQGAFIRRSGQQTVVWLEGEHDVATAEELWRILASAIARNDADVVVDLGGVQFMDGVTVGVFVRARTLLRCRSRSLVLRSPSRCARLVLDACGLGYLDGPRVVGAAGAAALGTWVAVPATPRAAESAEESVAKPASAAEPVGRGGL